MEFIVANGTSIQSRNILPRAFESIEDKSFNKNSVEATYTDSIYKKKFEIENDFVLKHPVFGTVQTEIDKLAYSKMCNFLSEVCLDQNLPSSTFILSMHIMDKVISFIPIKRFQMQLIGCCCLLLACKMDEIYPPFVDTLVYLAGRSFTKEDLLEMERTLLLRMKFQLIIPTRYEFAQYFAFYAKLNPKETQFLFFLMELSFLDYNLNYFRASQVAAAALHYTLQLLRPEDEIIWNQNLQKITRYSEHNILEIVLIMRKVHWCVTENHAVSIFHRYSSAFSSNAGATSHPNCLVQSGEICYHVTTIMALSYSNLRFNEKIAKDERCMRPLEYCVANRSS